jgi:hypothetical protein
MSNDGLILHTTERSTASRIVIGLFLLCTSGAGLWGGIAPPDRAQVAGREGERWRQERADSLVRDGPRMRTIDADLARRSNLKNHLDPWHSALLLRGFDEASNKVYVGSHGWLFLAARAGRPTVAPDDLGARVRIELVPPDGPGATVRRVGAIA